MYGQSNHHFSLRIKSSYNLGALFIGEAYFLPQYRNGLFKGDSASYSEGQYKFTNDRIDYPTAIRVYNLKSSKSILHLNQLLFIEPGVNEAAIVLKDSLLQLQTYSKIEQEHKFFLQQMGIHDLGKQVPMKKFQAYVEQHPKSYIALFALIDQQFNYGFSPEMRIVANKFDTSITSTKAFSYFREQYLDRKKFITMNVVNEEGKADIINFNPNKYTLMDFWWVGCKGCYEEMRALNQKGRSLSNRLTIVSINTDVATDFKKSRERFSKEKFWWKSYWDYEGTASEKNLFFYKYPTNLLIDKKGYIIATDIAIDRLEDFIKN